MSEAAAVTLGGNAPPAANPPAAAPPAAATPPAAAAPAAPTTNWWEGQAYSAEERNWLTARGLTKPDLAEVLPQVLKTARNAEQRIGKGLDTIMDRPAKDQPLPAFLKANAAVLGLPDTAEAYAVQPPADWPKGAAWDADLEAQARQVAFENGVPREAHNAYVAMFAEKIKSMFGAAEADLSAAKTKMMGELEADWGQQTDVRVNLARQAAQAFAAKAGLSPEAMAAMGSALARGTGDAAVIRMFAAIGEAMGEDTIVALNAGGGGGLTQTPAEARAELAQLQGQGGDWYKAVAANDRKAMAGLQPRMDQLRRVAAGTSR